MFMSFRRLGASFLLLGLLTAVPAVVCAEEPAPDKAAVAQPAAPAGDKAPEAVAPAPAGNPDDVLAEVGAVKLTRGQFEKELAMVRDPQAQAQFKSQKGKQDFLKQWVDVTLLELEAEKQKFADREELKKDMRETMVMALAAEHFKSEMEKTKVGDDQVKAFFTEHQKEFMEPDRFKVQQMTIDATAAADIKKELDGGKSFMEVAKAKSSDPFKDNGGDRGFVGLDDMMPQVGMALTTIKENELGGPIDIGNGQSMFVKYSEKQAGKPMEFKAVEGRIRQQLSEDSQQKAFEEIKKVEGFKLETANLEILQKEKPTAEELEKPLCTIGTDVIKLAALMPDLERLPPMFRAQLINDIVRQFTDKELLKRFVEKRFDEFAKKYPEAEKNARRRIGIKAMLDEKIGKAVTVSDEDIKDFYTKNLPKFARPARVRAHHILVKEEAKAKEILGKLDKEKFEDLAKAESTCPSGKEGGDLGFFGEGDMVPEFDKACKDAELNKVIGPVQTKFGYHLIRVDERQASGTAAMEEVKEEIKRQLLPERQKTAFEAFLAELRKAYPIKDFSDKL